ncbi:organic cation transporter protein [Chironomus tepperi]|uniref:organic cation transporter protein n=1 Tax=Chironomus tepperi TaxID=113505 RepID=UPI00391FA117
MAIDHALEELMSTLGDFGRYQGFQFFLHILSAVTAGLHMLSLVTIAAVPEHRCFIDGVDTNETIASWNSTDILSRIPLKENGDLDSCHMYTEGTNETIKCTQFVYDTTYYQDTRTIQWNMVCDNLYLGALAQTIYMLGVFTGAVTLGSLADKIGRKKVFCWSATLQLIIGVGVAFVPEYYSFLVVRYLYGIFGSAGSYITGFVLTMELVGPSKRTPCGVAFQAAFAFGIMLVAGWAALIKDRQLLQVIYGLHALILIAHWWIMDESPRWLWTQGRHAEAIDIVAKASRINKNRIGIDKQYYLSYTKAPRNGNVVETQKSFGISDLFKTPNLRMKTLNVCMCWFANSIGYYGLSLSSGKLGGNPFFNLFIMSLVEIPSYLAVILLLDRLGRRSITSSFMVVGGTACILAVFMAQKSTESTTTVFIGKLFIAGSFAVIYNYSTELFPTVVRSSLMGLGSMMARLSGALTPLIILFDSLNPKIPAIIFGAVSVVSGLWVLLLPETNGQPMPESLEDGENFGKGDTCFTTCLGRKPDRDEYSVPPEQDMVQEMRDINR